MKTAFIIHGTKGSPHGNWFKWLGEQLQKKGYVVIIPSFPTPENQSLESWKGKFEQYKKYVQSESIFIAHSIGPAFVTQLLQEIPVQVEGCFFVSGFIGDIGIEEFDTLNQSFFKNFPGKELIQKKAKKFYMCHGSNDPYVSLSSAKKLAKVLEIPIDIIPNGGHLNSEAGYGKFSYLLDKILK